MLTSTANQYLHPEYLTPLPTTLDAKKSPLALLAQTCSQIGVDQPNPKSPLGSSEGKSVNNKSSKSSEQPREKTSPTAGSTGSEATKSCFKPYEPNLGGEKTSSPDEQRSTSSHSTSGRSRTPGGNNRRCPSNQSASSARTGTPQSRKTGTPNAELARESPLPPASKSTTGNSLSAHAEAINTVRSTENSPLSLSLSLSSSSSLQTISSHSPADLLALTDPSIKDLPLGTFKPGVSLPSSTSAYLGYNHQLPIDVMANSLMSHHQAAVLKNGFLSASGAYHPGYGRSRGSNAPDSLTVCRDPYCTGCQLNSHLIAAGAKLTPSSMPTGGGSCPAGCTQCDHKPGSSSAYGPLGVAAYAHAQLAVLAAASQLPYACNWVAGDTAYCGKRFSTSDELLQHLRRHTNALTNAGNPDHTGAGVSLGSLVPHHVGLSSSHPLLSRSYPTPPLSPLATARYHPYGKPSPLLPPSLSSLGLPLTSPHPPPVVGLAPYFSAYSLYGAPRLGAASGMPQ